MLDLSMGEIGVIAAIALVVLGPDKLPQVAKTAGSLMGCLLYTSEAADD